jgi:hypothetical protein
VLVSFRLARPSHSLLEDPSHTRDLVEGKFFQDSRMLDDRICEVVYGMRGTAEVDEGFRILVGVHELCADPNHLGRKA